MFVYTYIRMYTHTHIKDSQALPIKEGDYVLRLAEKETELQRVSKAMRALQEHKLRLQVLQRLLPTNS
jgi:hypothetical protein